MEVATPIAFVLLLLIPLMLLGRARGRGIVLPGFATAGSLPSSWRVRLRKYLPIVRVLAAILLVVALARPREGQASAVVPATGIDIALALDLSGSMTSSEFDEGVSRLEGAKLVITDFIDSRPDDRIGVAAFQRAAIPISPPTLDHDALKLLIDELESGLLTDGTAIGLGLGAAVDLLSESSSASRVVILLTDGAHNTPDSIEPMHAARLAEALDIRVYTVGIAGSSAGGGGVDDELLTQLAETTGGNYYRASSLTKLDEIYDEIGMLETSDFARERFLHYREYGPWIAGAAAVLLLADLLLRATIFRRVTA